MKSISILVYIYYYINFKHKQYVYVFGLIFFLKKIFKILQKFGIKHLTVEYNKTRIWLAV